MLKNKKRISLFTLAVYVAFLTVALFHNHPYYLGAQKVLTDFNSSQHSSNQDPFLDNQSNCRIAQLSHSAYSNINASCFSVSNLPIIKNFKITHSEKKYEDLVFNLNQLRAPPII